ncbi:MAG: MarR family transcriptional regulator [Spirochaetaceae bacterium]|nr:MarR family transcriptional regulator [Spirochaetaceae bacterium]
MDEIDLMESIAASRRRQASRSVRPFEITLMQYHLILLARRRGPLSPSQAARELECDRPGMTLLARKCVRSGWLSRRRSSADRRSSRLELTGEGEELLDKIEAAQAVSPASLGDPLAVLDPAERGVFREMLSRVHARAMELRD